MSSRIHTDTSSFSESVAQPLTLVELLRWRAAVQPDALAYTFLSDGETEETTLTYAELDRRARAIAVWLQSLVSPGDRVLLLYPPGLEYIAAFFGCLYAGAVAVPAYPPRRNRNVTRLQALVADAGATIALTTAPILSRVTPLFSQNPFLEPLRWLTCNGIAEGVEENWQEPAICADDLAFLQYTSGSTSLPKGVMLSHKNLLSNEQLIQQVFQQTEQSVIVGWLPMYHDMGLIGNVLQPIFIGATCILMSPMSFLQSPYRWLQAISHYRGTTSGGPNFAYELCIRKISEAQRATLDLSSWSVAFNGAEPIRHDTLERFAEAFASCGFKREAFSPCYGLAEATLIVSGYAGASTPSIKRVQARALESNCVLDASADEPGARALVGCGHTLTGQQIVIVDPESMTLCAPDRVGEIWVSGKSVAQGYWNQPEVSERTFQAHLSDTGEGPFLRTGDLGFLEHGELFVTGRLKDLIIIRGRNHYPQDIERTVEECHTALRPGAGAAFSVEVAGEERLVMVQEVDHRRQFEKDEVIAAIKEALAQEHEVNAHSIILIKHGTIPKTSSGKIQRHACRQAFLEKSFEELAEWHGEPAAEPESTALAPLNIQPESAEEIQAWLRAQVAAKLGLDAAQVDVGQPVTRYGLDSLASIELMHSIEVNLGLNLSFATFFQEISIAELAAQVWEQLSAKDHARLHAGLAPAHETISVSPLSHGQQALWFLYQLEPKSAAYNIVSAVRILSGLDVDALRRAFQTMVDRHPSLRTTFGELDGEVVQLIHEQGELHFQEEDATAWSEAALKERLLADAYLPFNLEQGPLMRLHLYRRGAGEHYLLLAIHHIVADFWSLAVLVQELGVVYEAERSEQTVALTPLSLQYTDYVRWQGKMLAGAEGERLWGYWQKQLAGETPVLNLPTDRPRPRVQTYSGSSHSFRLSAELKSELKALGQKHGATLYMTLLAAFQSLLYRYTQQTDIVVGSPTAGRKWAEVAGLVGYLVNPVAVRVDLADDPSFENFLPRVRRTVLDAFDHQDYPFALLVERLQPERDPARSPLFQVMFVLQKAHLSHDEALASLALGEAGARMNLAGLACESLSLEQRVAPFDLTLMMAEVEEGLSASLQYNTDLFDPATIERMAGHFETLLRAIVSDQSRPISELPLLTEAERHQLLRAWNDTRGEYERGRCMHQLFDAQVKRTPDSIALICGEERLTYAELNERANRLAHYLQSHGVEAETLVGVFMERTLEMVVGLLGILKAGGTYVPLDPAYPKSRLEFILEDTQAPLVLTHERLARSLPECRARLINLDTDWEQISKSSPATLPATPQSRAVSDNLAYIIYTSGSTGRPKGVAIEHHSAVTLLEWSHRTFAPRHLQGVLASTSICFDLSVFELFVPLTCGGKVLLAENALQLPHLPALHEVTLINTVPSAMTELVRMEAVPESVRVVNLAGEPLAGKLVQEIYRQQSTEAVINLYGPSEDTTYTTYAILRRGDEAAPPIGRPITDTQIYLLDKHLQPVPIGVPGELCISGEGLARGYLNRPELTAEKFIPDHLGQEPGGRLYRTGDLARYLPDGSIEYLGRLDHQVKIRGFRIELGEIETALRQHPAVSDVVVVAREVEPGDKRLVAYLVHKHEAVTATSELREYLREKLPAYMIPSSFVRLAELPLTPNGKIDRRALPAPDLSRLEMEQSYVTPCTPEEEMLASIWADLLKLERVGVHDNFFELGGHSLLATQLISRVRSVFQQELPLRALFENPTVSAFARVIKESARELLTHPITPVPREGELPLSFAQHRLWFLNKLEPDSAFYNFPAVVRLKGRLNIAALEEALSALVMRHESLRTTFPTIEGRAVLTIHPSVQTSIDIKNLSHLSGAELEAETRRLTIEEAQRPFNLGQGPLLRVTLLRQSDEEHQLLLIMHHIITDGWSMSVLIREMAALYESFSAGQPHALPDLPIQYADFAHWQQQWMAGETLETQLSYWREQLAEAPPVLELPTDRPRPAMQSFRGMDHAINIDAELAQELRALSRREGVTLFMTLLAGFQTLLYRYTGQRDILVGTPIANRNRSEVEGLIGFFVNTLVMRAKFHREMSARELLGQLRDVTLAAYGHQDLPFEKIVEELQPERDMSRSPLFQVMFVLQNAPAETSQLRGLELEQVRVHSGTSKFDLTLSLEESGSDGLVGTFEYSTDLFDSATIERMAEHFLTLLRGIVHHPHRRLSELPLLSHAESHQLLREWNDTQRDYKTTQFIHQLFEAHALNSPDAIALIFDEQQLSCAELNTRANQLAHHLIALGIGPESIVAVLLERSVHMVVALLAVLKAGAAYLPLDPDYPAARLDLMLQDSQPSLLLTQKQLIERLPPSSAEVLDLDELSEQLEREEAPSSNPEVQVSADNLAYVIYTSGSTGKPKAAMNTHAGILNRLLWMQEQYGLDGTDAVLQKTPYSFDVSVWEFFWPLMVGSRLVVAKPGGHRDPQYLVEVIEREQITTMHFVPSMLEVFVESEGAERCHSLRRVMSSGEALPYELEQRFLSRFKCELHNLYGPTEAAVDVSYWACRAQDERRIVPIGRPIANLQLYVLDEEMQLVPAGVAGEIYIGGAGLGRGYLNRPETTAERFVPHPYSAEGGARLYRTGDAGRFLPGGEIEYLGRLDEQVKIRGHRIELGEVASVLRQHAAVREAHVAVTEGTDKRLVAYVVTEGEAEESELRSFLRERVPEYMVVQHVVKLERMPVTSNGKVDRRKLPKVQPTREHLALAYIAPRTPAEETLAQIWMQILGLEEVGVHDNFFELGGDSILSIQIIARAKQAGLQLTPKQMFQHQTIAELASVAETVETIKAEQGLVSGPVPLTPAQRWFFESEPLDPHHFNQALMLETRQPLEPAVLERALHHISLHHDALRLRFERAEEGQWRQHNATEAPRPIFSYRDLSGLEEERQRGAIESVAADEQASLNLSAGPLFKATLFHLGQNRPGRLLLVAHHLLVDGVSWRVLIEDLQKAYTQLSLGQEIELGPKTTSFKQWAEELEQYAASGALESELAHWLELSGRSIRRVPVDSSGPNTVESACSLTVSLSAAQTQMLLQQVPSAYRTQINEVLLTALAESFRRVGCRELLIDLEGHGREELISGVDLSRTVGWFTSIYPVLLETAGAQPWDTLKRIKDHLRAIPQKGIGYGLLRYLAPPEAHTWRETMPSAEVSFNYFGQLDQFLSGSSLLALAGESVGPSSSPRSTRRYLIEINGSITGGRMQLIWTYSRNLHRRSTIQRLADDFINALRKLIDNCHSTEVSGFTPSDFPLANLDQDKLSKLSTLLNKKNK